MLGRQVKTLINQTQDAGYKSVIWNATNDYDKPVSAGIYLYQIQAGEYISTKKMVLLKQILKLGNNQAQDAGFKSVVWNATNDYGKQVSAGIYLYQIQAGEYISTKKMVLLK